MAGLPWVRLDTSMPDNPKILQLCTVKDGHRAAFVYCCSLSYAGKHGTNGFIPAEALARINGRTVDADRLVDVGLWVVTAGGWDVHGWAEYQQAAESTAKVRAAQKKGASKGNCVRHHGPDCGCWERGSADLRAVR